MGHHAHLSSVPPQTWPTKGTLMYANQSRRAGCLVIAGLDLEQNFQSSKIAHFLTGHSLHTVHQIESQNKVTNSAFPRLALFYTLASCATH